MSAGVSGGLPAPEPGGHCAGSGPRPIRPASRCRNVQRPVDGDLAVVGAQCAAHLHHLVCARPSAATGHRHRRPGGCLRSHAAPGRWAAWGALALQVGGRRAQQAPVGCAAGNHASASAARQSGCTRRTHRRASGWRVYRELQLYLHQWCWRKNLKSQRRNLAAPKPSVAFTRSRPCGVPGCAKPAAPMSSISARMRRACCR